MGRFRRLSVVVIVLTLAPMQAWAECAWVLWESGAVIENKSGVTQERLMVAEWESLLVDELKRGGVSTESTTPFLALESRRECEATLAAALQSLRANGARVEARTAVWLSELGGTRLIRAKNFQCLPDTIDPRGPKGSGR
jgi:hypothetical protein